MVILADLKVYFKCGNINIDNKDAIGYKYVVSNLKDISDKIIPHFDKYCLVGSKYLDFLSFKQAADILNSDIPQIEKFNKLNIIKNKMNKSRSFEERWNYLQYKNIVLDKAWVQAFIDGEGTFQCRIAETKSRNSTYIAVNPTLEIAQNTHDIKVLDSIKKFLGAGYLKPKYNITSLEECLKVRSVSRLVINDENAVISFVDNNPMYTAKHLDYSDWKLLINLKKENLHKTSEGLENMINIKNNMNRGRLLSNNTLNPIDKLKIVRWVNSNLD